MPSTSISSWTASSSRSSSARIRTRVESASVLKIFWSDSVLIAPGRGARDGTTFGESSVPSIVTAAPPLASSARPCDCSIERNAGSRASMRACSASGASAIVGPRPSVPDAGERRQRAGEIERRKPREDVAAEFEFGAERVEGNTDREHRQRQRAVLRGEGDAALGPAFCHLQVDGARRRARRAGPPAATSWSGSSASDTSCSVAVEAGLANRRRGRRPLRRVASEARSPATGTPRSHDAGEDGSDAHPARSATVRASGQATATSAARSSGTRARPCRDRGRRSARARRSATRSCVETRGARRS